MNFTRTTRVTYLAAFLLGAVIALLLAPAGRSAEAAAPAPGLLSRQDLPTGFPARPNRNESEKALTADSADDADKTILEIRVIRGGSDWETCTQETSRMWIELSRDSCVSREKVWALPCVLRVSWADGSIG